MWTKLLLATSIAGAFPVGAAVPGPSAELSADTPSGANRRFSVRCAAKPLPLDALLSDPGFRSDLDFMTDAEKADIRDYAVCRALQGAPEACEALKDSKQCLILAAEYRFAFLVLRGGDAFSACRSQLALEGRRGPAVDKGCAALVAVIRREGVNLSCESLGRALGSQEGCEEIRTDFSGDSRACARLPVPLERRDCLPRAALVAGLRDGSKCAASPACRALVVKSPDACDPLRAELSRGLCARVERDLVAERRRLESLREALRLKAKAAADAAAAAETAAKAKAEAAVATAKAKEAAARAKHERLAAAEAARKAAAEAIVRAKAEAEEKKAAAAKAKIERQRKPQFREGEPMEATPPEALEIIKALEEGRPLPPPRKRKPVKSPPKND